LSVKGSFDDVRDDAIKITNASLTQVTMFQCWDKFCNGLVR